MPLRRIHFALFSLGLTFLGCKDKPAPEGASVRPDIPPPAPSATAVVTATPSASAVEQAPTPPPTSAWPAGPKFAVRHHTSQKSHFAWLGKAVVVCDSGLCRGDAFAVTEKGIVDTYEPTEAIQLRHPQALKLDGLPWGYSYSGNYPDVCTTVIYYGDRDNSTGVTLKRSGKTWVDGNCASSPSYNDYPEVVRRPPRELDDALLHAPIADAAKTIVRGANAPPMLIAKNALHVWDGKTWSTKEGPWKSHDLNAFRNETTPSTRPVRLANGSTLVLEGGYYINAQGEIGALQLIQDDKPVAANVEIVGAIWEEKSPWLIAMDDKEIYLATIDASEKTSFVRAPIPERSGGSPIPAQAPQIPNNAPSAIAGAAPPSTANPAPSGSTSTPELIPSAWDDFNAATKTAPSNAAPSKPVELPAFTAECKTPFVLLASPPKPGQTYATTRESLKGHGEFQDLVTFVEIVIDEKTLFGVQTRTEADAKSFIELVTKNVKGMKPALRCFDVVSKIPDRYAPPPGMRIVGINLTTGELVPFD